MTEKRKIKVKLNELKNADVTYVSLVDRSASRIPFRVMKRNNEEQDMSIDLNRIGRTLKGEKTQKSNTPEVVAIVVEGREPAYLDKARVAISASGFDVGTVTKNEDSSVTFKQGEITEGDHIVRISNRMLVVMKGFDAASEILSENSGFSDLVAVEGYFPGIDVATKGIGLAVEKTLKSDSPKLTTLLNQFSTYIDTLSKSIPAPVFKADLALKGIQSDELPTSPPNGVNRTDWEAMSDQEKIDWVEDSTNSANASGAQKGDITAIAKFFASLPLTDSLANKTIAGQPWSSMSTVDKISWLTSSYNNANPAGAQNDQDGGAGGAVPDGTASIQVDAVTGTTKGESDNTPSGSPADGDNDDVNALGCPQGIDKQTWGALPASAKIAIRAQSEPNKAVKSDLAAITAAINAAVAPISTVLNTVNSRLDSQQELINEVAKKAEQSLKAVKGTVHNLPVGDDKPSKEGDKIIKSDDTDPRTGCFDTAFIHRRSK